MPERIPDLRLAPSIEARTCLRQPQRQEQWTVPEILDVQQATW